MTEKFCKAFKGTLDPPLIICDQSLKSSQFLTGTEVFHNKLIPSTGEEKRVLLKKPLSKTLSKILINSKEHLPSNRFPSNTFLPSKIETIFTSSNTRKWIQALIKAEQDEKQVILVPMVCVYDELSLSLGIALTACKIESIVCLSEEVLECYLQTAKALEIFSFGVNVVSCPTCGRCHQELESIVKAVKDGTNHIKTPLTIAIMGCEVNGPGEARHADIGIASSKSGSILFKNGKEIKTLTREDAVKTVIAEAEKMVKP